MTQAPEIHGLCPARFNAVKDAFAANFTDAPEGLNELAARFSVVIDGEVLIVDEHTGRSLPGRRYNEGLHQALEAKEGVEIKDEYQTLATITLQNYFRMYEKISGMTGTAKTEESEFQKIYGLGVLPMAISTGAGANARHAIGTGVIGGMFFATFLGLLLIPVFFVSVRRMLGDRMDEPSKEYLEEQGKPASR